MIKIKQINAQEKKLNFKRTLHPQSEIIKTSMMPSCAFFLQENLGLVEFNGYFFVNKILLNVGMQW